MMSLNLLSLLGSRLKPVFEPMSKYELVEYFARFPTLRQRRTIRREPYHPPEASEKSEAFLFSECIIKAGIYDRPLQKHAKREYIKSLYNLSTP